MKLALLIAILFFFDCANCANCLGTRWNYGCNSFTNQQACVAFTSLPGALAYDCQWNPTTLTCSASSTSCTIACNTRTQVSNCSTQPADSFCLGKYQNVNGNTKFCMLQSGACGASTVSCVTKPACPTALTAVANCFGTDPSVCSQKFEWSGNAFQCYVDSNALCVASTDSCVPPCFPPGRNPTPDGSCFLGNASVLSCSTYSAVNQGNGAYCVWLDGPPPYNSCGYGIKCHTNLMNCPTATQAVADCSTLTSQSTCQAGFLWGTSSVQQCGWNQVSLICTASTVQCIPPCLPPGRSAGICSSKTTQLTCLQTTDTTVKAYCAWTSGMCSNGLTCHT